MQLLIRIFWDSFFFLTDLFSLSLSLYVYMCSHIYRYAHKKLEVNLVILEQTCFWCDFEDLDVPLILSSCHLSKGGR